VKSSRPTGSASPPPLKGEPAEPAEVKVGYLTVSSRPWAKVLVDKRDIGKRTPIPSRGRISLSPGKHTVTLVTKDGKKHNFRVNIVVGETFHLEKVLQ
jgi:hypothetical protein